MRDFFVSYTKHDEAWAEWIAWHLEEHGYSVVIQRWDFVGNWIRQMDRAMRESKRTIAVLSPQYLESVYALSEWQNAFRLDPTGKKDLLVPFRVAECEPQGILAQIVYTDLILLPEGQAKERLLKRVSGLRGKPDQAPGFPGAHKVVEHQTVSKQPPYPAAEEDLTRLQRFRILARDWRDRYATRLDELRQASERARSYRDNPPPDDDERVRQLAEIAADVAEQLAALDREALEFAKPYGLYINAAVLEDFGLSLVYGAKRDLERLRGVPRAEREAFGVDSVIGTYTYENMARVLEAAVAIARFDLNRLPRGYLSATGIDAPKDLRGREPLLLASTGEGTLLLLSPTSPREPLGVLAARSLPLHLIAAQVNSKGSLDVLATDSQHIYHWLESNSLPVQQVPIKRMILDGAFLSRTTGSDAITIDSDGAVRVVSPNGSKPMALHEPLGKHIEAAHVHIDTLDRSIWAIVVVTNEGEVASVHPDGTVVRRSGEDIWNVAAFEPPAPDLGPLWYSGNFSLTMGAVDGLPCALVVRGSAWGPAACFLDPLTLQTVRRPERLPTKPASPIAYAFGGSRWLLATCRDSDARGPRLLVYDLATERAPPLQPAGESFDVRGDTFDPVIIAHKKNSFRAAFVLQHFDKGPLQYRSSLCTFDWPSGQTETLTNYPKLMIWPVAGMSEP